MRYLTCFEYQIFKFHRIFSPFLKIEVWLIPNVVLVSCVQHNDSVVCIYIYIRILSQILSHCRLLQDE